MEITCVSNWILLNMKNVDRSYLNVLCLTVDWLCCSSNNAVVRAIFFFLYMKRIFVNFSFRYSRSRCAWTSLCEQGICFFVLVQLVAQICTTRRISTTTESCMVVDDTGILSWYLEPWNLQNNSTPATYFDVLLLEVATVAPVATDYDSTASTTQHMIL